MGSEVGLAILDSAAVPFSTGLDSTTGESSSVLSSELDCAGMSRCGITLKLNPERAVSVVVH